MTSLPARVMRPSRRGLQSGDDAQERRLAGATGSKKDQHLAIGDIQIDRLERGCLVEALGHALNADQGLLVARRGAASARRIPASSSFPPTSVVADGADTQSNGDSPSAIRDSAEREPTHEVLAEKHDDEHRRNDREERERGDVIPLNLIARSQGR